MDELMRAYGQTLDELKLMRRLAHNTTMVVEIDGEISRISHALSATVAEIRKRRAESLWKGPFFAQRGARTGEEGPEWNGMWEVADRQIEWVCERSECDEAETIAAALNAYYGYDAQGNDLLEGMGV